MGKTIHLRAGLTAAILGLLAVTASAQEENSFLGNGNFDSNIAGWTVTESPPGEIEWDGGVGLPRPGSLRLTVDTSNAERESHRVVAQCQQAVPGETFTVEGNVLPNFGARAGRCFVRPVYYDEAGCQGESSVGGSGQATPDGTWDTQASSATAFAGSVSMRAELFMVLEPGSGSARCNFDSVAFYEGLPPNHVPAGGGLWLLALVGGVAAVGSLTLVHAGRRRPTE